MPRERTWGDDYGQKAGGLVDSAAIKTNLGE